MGITSQVRDSAFQEAVLRHFSFLRGFGYTLSEFGGGSARFESRTGILQIAQSRVSLEIGESVGFRSMPGLILALSDLMEYAFGSPSSAADVAASGLADIERVVGALASETRRLGNPALRPDRRFYEAARAAKQYREDAARSAEALRRARILAERARMAKDYEAMAAALSPFESSLAELERRWLYFARERVGSRER